MEDKIVIYGKSGCPFSQAAKDYYEGKGIPYIYYDVLSSKSLFKEFLKIAPEKSVPIIVEGDKVTVGFQGGT
ncbi:Glutaredoxin [Desulfotomaculum arcticum]|uniref:Glutaredoxin n=1 Tax=Desulfotruncus arcticus DSM 17038 TaxID=1121424 RepID=A0A1I2Q7I4_9FIRM|nr:glutaredoxin [Desulfotruncus arcticus]SFG24314.1 Glutaredoxin [Desulfotomaculum arcticum] [Desulfotruncus arcticus DSM 17038]